jgi:hypothetical protein
MSVGPTRCPISTAPMFDDTAMICVVREVDVAVLLDVLRSRTRRTCAAGHVPVGVGCRLAEVEHGRRRHDLGH